MKINTSDFVKSSSDYKMCPEEHYAEFAFIGRSNVGKSSLINMLCDRNSLAKTSSKPGKTQLLNHFIINEEWFLVDLPGYGYAKTSKTNKSTWKKMIDDYILYRPNLCLTFLLIDSRHEPQKNDIRFMAWMSENDVPFAIIFTKMDKIGKQTQVKNIENYKKELLKTWEELPQIFLSAAIKKEGREEILTYIESIIESLTEN